MNELDYILIFIVLVGVGVGYRRGVVRVLISTLGIYFTAIVAGYAYKPIGDTLAGGLRRLDISIGNTGTENFVYVVTVIAMTVVVELTSRATFESTRLRVLPVVDKALGATFGILYGMFWASLFLVAPQYGISQSSGTWAAAVFGSTLVPKLNSIFRTAVLNIVGIFFLNGTPELYINKVSLEVSHLFLDLAFLGYLFF